MTPARERFKAALEQAQSITEQDMAAAVARLPAGIAYPLERGPLAYRYGCGVCQAFGRDFYTGEIDLEDPLWVVWLYHEAPKHHMTHRDQLHYGEHANEIYRRCLAVYRAAGWRGEASEANA